MLCLSMLPHQLLEHRRVSTNQLINILSVLKDEKGGHSADTELSRQIRQLINVELDKLDALKVGLIRQPVEVLGMMRNSLRLDAYLERMGEMALHGPHQVAKQSTRTALSVVETSSLNSAVLNISTLVEKYGFLTLLLTHVLISRTASLAAELWKGLEAKATALGLAAWEMMGRTRRNGEAILNTCAAENRRCDIR